MPRDLDDDEPRTGFRSELMESVDLISRKLGAAIMIAGGLIGAGIYFSGGGDEAPTYQAFAADGEVFRVNTDNGRIIACNANRCTQILEHGQDLAEDQANTLFKSPPALPAPASQPTSPAPAVRQPNPGPAPTPPTPPAE